MLERNTVRTVVTLVAALCVVTMFAGSAAAVDLGAVEVADSSEDGAVDIDTVLESDASQSGGVGTGGVSVQTDQGGAQGNGTVDGDVTNQSLTVAAAGEGGPAGNPVGGAVECEISPDSAQNPQSVCDPSLPGGDGNPLPDDQLPGLPGLPDDPGSGVPVDGLQAI